MGIPFFMYGESVIYKNVSDKRFSSGIIDLALISNKDKYFIHELFTYNDLDNVQISKTQKEYVLECLGVDHSISRFEMRKLLYWAYFQKENVGAFLIRLLTAPFLLLWRRCLRRYSLSRKILYSVRDKLSPIKRKIKTVLMNK
jgi:hypothetical protein